MTALRLKAYAPNGADLGPLPTPQDANVSWVLNDLGALTLTYPYYGPRAELLGQPLEVAAEVSADDGATWTEPPGGRFLYLRDGRDPVKDDAWTADCPAYLNRLKKAVVGFTGLDADGRRTFTNRSVGFILTALIGEAQARGALTGLTWDFGNGTDSAGAAWSGAAASVTITYDVGRDLLSILQEFATLGWVDYTSQARTVRMFNPGNGSVDRTATTEKVTLRRGQDLTEAPTRRTWENLADKALVLGDEGATATRTAAGATRPWGTQETFVAAAGVTDAGTLAAVGDAALALTKEVRAEYTLGQSFGRGGPYRPFRDYRPGDWVGLVTDGAAPARVRVRQVTLTLGANGETGGNVVLNDRFSEADVVTQRRLEALTGGASTVGTGGTPSGIGPDILAPNKAGTPVLSSVAYTTGVIAQAQVTADWPDLTTNADGTAMTDLKGYQVQRRKAGGQWATFATDVAASLLTSSPYEPGTTWEFRVRGVDTAGNEGAWSDSASIQAAYDTTGPTAPKKPILVSRLGGITVDWDGRNGTNGGPMDGDLDRVEVHISTTSAFTPAKHDPATLKGTITAGGGYLYVGGLAFNATYFVRLLPIDTSDNAGTPSAQESVLVKPLVDVSNFPDDAMDVLYARTAHFIEVTADMIQANAVEAIHLKADAIDGKTITGATVRTASTGERLILRNDGSGGIMEAFSGLAGEVLPSVIDPAVASESLPTLTLMTGTTDTVTQRAFVRITSGRPYDPGNTAGRSAILASAMSQTFNATHSRLNLRAQQDSIILESPASVWIQSPILRLDGAFTDGSVGTGAFSDSVADVALMRWGGAEGMSFGGAPPAGTRKRVAEGTVIVTTGAGGTWAMPLPGPAWSGIQAPLVTPGDAASNLGFVRVTPATFTSASVRGVAFTPAGATLASGLNIRLNFRVVGW